MTTTGTPAEAARLVHAEPVWDTVVSLQLVTCDPDVDLPAARDAVVRWVHLVDEVLSTFRPDSDLSRWRAGTCSLADCDPMVEEVLLLAEEARWVSHGAFDPTWSDGAPDPTGLVKGWAGERALDVLAAHGVVDAQVNAGGDVAATGRRADGRPWRIGIAHPIRRDGLVAVLEGTDLRVATSGTTERAGHLRRGGRPVDDVLSVSVAGDDLGRADALSTALAAVGPHRTTLAHELDAAGWPSLTVSPDGSVATTPGWSCSPRWVAS